MHCGIFCICVYSRNSRAKSSPKPLIHKRNSIPKRRFKSLNLCKPLYNKSFQFWHAPCLVIGQKGTRDPDEVFETGEETHEKIFSKLFNDGNVRGDDPVSIGDDRKCPDTILQKRPNILFVNVSTAKLLQTSP